MTSALILKELRQHWLPLVLICGMLAFGFLILLGVVILDDSGSPFEAVRRFLIALLPLGILVLCNRLVVREYQSNTQLFLESLPLSRWRMVAVKYFLGLTFVLVALALAFALTIMISLRSEPLTGRFLAIMTARACAYSWCLYSFFFMMGLMGRYRVAIYLIGVLVLMAVETMTRVELARFGPIAVVDGQFPYERVVFPQQALLVSIGIALVVILLTLFLSLVREGTVATLLAEKMTHREKIVVTAVTLTFMVAVSIYDKRIEKRPFDLPGAVEAACENVTVRISSEQGVEDDQSLGLAQLVADEASAMQQYLGLSDPPPIFITQWGELDAYRFERAELDGAEGLLVRANLKSGDWDDGRFLAWLLRELLIVWSDRRLQWEPNHWILDGFPVYWTCRDEALAARDREQIELRAAYGASLEFSPNEVAEWLSYRERVGEEIAAAVAWQGLETFRQRQGEERFREFLQAAMDCSVPADVRGMLHEWSRPIPKIIAKQGGSSYSELIGEWSKGLAKLARSRRRELDAIPRISGDVTFESLSDYTRLVRFRFESKPPPESGSFALLYAELPAFAEAVEPSEIRREDGLYEENTKGELRDTFERKTRFYSTFAAWVEVLGCEIITGWTREEME